jgi:hypothetical protein
MSSKHDELYGILDDLMVVARTVVGAIREDAPERVHDILPRESFTTIAKAAADAKARHKFR